MFATFFKFTPNNNIQNTNTSPSPSAAIDSYKTPIVKSEIKNDTVYLSGTVPPGWMFEGSFTLKLLDKHSFNIYPIIVSEKTPGSWMSGKPIEFEVTAKPPKIDILHFAVLEKSNPSGLSENDENFWVNLR